MRPDPTYAVRVATIEGALEEYLGQITRDAAKGIHPAPMAAGRILTGCPLLLT